MAEPRSRRTGEHNAQIVKLQVEAAQMRAQLVALEARVERLEAELKAARKGTGAGAGGGTPGAKVVVPPPLPPTVRHSMPSLPKSTGRKSVVDISEIAELVIDSTPPATTRSPRK